MKYMGSKRRFSKYIVPIMLDCREDGQSWVEPFVGGGNVIENIKGQRIGADSNPYLIEALISIRDCIDELPRSNKEFTESDYRGLANSDTYTHKGYAGFAFSYASKWLGGWRRGKNAKGVERDYVNEAYKNALKQSPLLQGVDFICCDYKSLEIPKNSLVYCDPPYENTTKYYGTSNFSHIDFWDWCRNLSRNGHTVFVSEYKAPEDFECVWSSKPVSSSLQKNTGSRKGVEKLFKFEK